MIDRLKTLPAGCCLLLALSAITATGQAETELEFSYSDEWSVVSAPPPSGPYRAVHVDPRVPGQGVTPPVTAAFDVGRQADDNTGVSPQAEADSEVVQQAVDASAAGMDTAAGDATALTQEAAGATEPVAAPETMEAPGATVAAEEIAQPSPVVTATEEIQEGVSDMQALPGRAAAGTEGQVPPPPALTATPYTTPVDTRGDRTTTDQPPAAAIAASPAAPPAQPPAGHASAGIPAGDMPLASQSPMPGMIDSMMPPAAGHPAIRQPVPPAAAGGDAPADMPPPVPGQYGQMQPGQPAYGYPQSSRQGGGYPQSGWRGGGYPQYGRQGGGYPQYGRRQGGGYPQSSWQGGGYPGHMNTSPYGYYRAPADMSGTEVPPPADYQAPPDYGGNTYPVR